MMELVQQRLASQYGPLADRLRNALASAIEDGSIAPRQALPHKLDATIYMKLQLYMYTCSSLACSAKLTAMPT